MTYVKNPKEGATCREEMELAQQAKARAAAVDAGREWELAEAEKEGGPIQPNWIFVNVPIAGTRYPIKSENPVIKRSANIVGRPWSEHNYLRKGS